MAGSTEDTLLTLWTVTGASDGDAAPAPELDPDAPRYVQQGLVGEGGMGQVWRVHDRLLNRHLVRKVLRPQLARDGRAVRQFTNEARITAFLQHPGVVPVLDIGVLEDGRPYYTMQEVRGPRLGDVVGLGHRGEGGWSVRRLVDAVRRVADVVAMAHQRGVVHRDLKPDNVMVGEFGEVLVLDWGVARASPPVGREEFPGQIVGTAVFVAPEMARGEPVGPPSDVFLLGGLLHQVLCRRPPRTGPSAAALRAARTEPVPPLPPSVDRDLAAIGARALSFDPADRHADAGGFARALADWLDGRLRRERALQVVGEAEGHRRRRARLAAEADALRQRASAVLAPLKTYDPADAKVPGWRLEDTARDREAGADLAADLEEQALQAALRIDPSLPEAHDALAGVYRERHTHAERAGDRLAAARLEERLRAHDRGAHARYLAGDGAITLVTDPPGAEVALFRYTPVDRRLEPLFVRSLGTTPLHAVPVPIGSYLLVIRHVGRAEVRYPVRILRAEHWDGRPPGAQAPAPVHLPAADALGPDDCYVPGGWCDTGGDPEAADGLARRRIWVDPFVIGRFPVTHGAFVAFLNDLVDRGRAVEAERWAPRGSGGEERPDQDAYPRDGARYAVTDAARELPWTPEMPVSGVSWRGARAFAAWHAARTGLPWRLPHSLEWEKAGRGVDGRAFPWGDHLEYTWACSKVSTAGAAWTVPIHDYPLDVSPYGVRGLVGNVRDLCLDGYTRDAPPDGWRLTDPATRAPSDDGWRSVRGGSCTTGTNQLRLCARAVTKPDSAYAAVGFRLVRSVS